MTDELKTYEQSIKKKHRFAWTPKYEEEFHTNLNRTLLVAIASKVFEKLDWDIVFQDEEIIEAKRRDKRNKWTEKIIVTYQYGKVKVKSISLGNGYWDNGKNSLRVKLFIHAFLETEKEYNKEDLANLEKEMERSNNWDDYVVPTELPLPKKYKSPNLSILLIGAMLSSLLLGYIVAFLTIEFKYILFLFEFLIGLALAFVFKQLIKLSNYTDFEKFRLISIASIIAVFASNQYFQYLIISDRFENYPFSFFDFMKMRFEVGFHIESLNTGWIGLIVFWIIQVLLTYWFFFLSLLPFFIRFQSDRVPYEVIEFAVFHFIKGKTEEQVRCELSNMGWKEKNHQDEVFEAIGAFQNIEEVRRME